MYPLTSFVHILTVSIYSKTQPGTASSRNWANCPSAVFYKPCALCTFPVEHSSQSTMLFSCLPISVGKSLEDRDRVSFPWHPSIWSVQNLCVDWGDLTSRAPSRTFHPQWPHTPVQTPALECEVKQTEYTHGAFPLGSPLQDLPPAQERPALTMRMETAWDTGCGCSADPTSFRAINIGSVPPLFWTFWPWCELCWRQCTFNIFRSWLIYNVSPQKCILPVTKGHAFQ